MIPLIRGIQSSQIYRDGEQDDGFQGLGGRENGELLFNGYRVQFCKMKRVLEMDGGDGCTTM